MSQARGGICTACRNLRPLEQLLVFWPRRDPERQRYVCRPSVPQPAVPLPCFRQVVMGSAHHAIALTPPAPAERPKREARVQPWLREYVSARNEPVVVPA